MSFPVVANVFSLLRRANFLQDLSKLGGESVSTQVPLEAIVIAKPDDGLPCIADFQTTCLSFIFNGSRLYREPIDLYVIPSHDSEPPKLGVKKGFTRLQLDSNTLIISSLIQHSVLKGIVFFPSKDILPVAAVDCK